MGRMPAAPGSLPRVAAGAAGVLARPWRRAPGAPAKGTPRLKLRLRTVLIIVSLSVLAVPLGGLYALRLHESTLLRQTQAELALVATFIATAYRTAYRARSGEVHPPTALAQPLPPMPELDFGAVPVLPPFPDPRPAAAQAGAGQRADAEAARRAGRDVSPLLGDARAIVRAGVRLLDGRGVVVGGGQGDLGRSLAHASEVRQALGGAPAGTLRSAANPGPLAGAAPIVRGAAVEVFLALPVHAGERLIGVVLVSRAPSNIVDALHDQRVLLAQGGAVFLAVAVGIALVTARTLVLPIKRLVRGAGRVSRGEVSRFERGRHYRVNELADLADSIETMVASLQRRTSYVRDFARQVSHEFKTPIAAARGAVELLRDHLADMAPGEAAHFVDNIGADVERLERLTSRLVDLAQADMAEASDEATDVLEVARALAKPAVRVAGTQPTVARIASASWAAVLEHLVDNAVRHGATRVDVAARRVGAAIDVTVADNGAGISPANRARVFDPFFTTCQGDGGTGLGLAICRSLVRSAGGDISLGQADEGATFKLTLAAADTTVERG